MGHYLNLYIGDKINSVYLSKKASAYIVEYGIVKNQEIPKNILDTAEVICTKNTNGEIRHKLSFRINSKYATPNEIAEIFDAPNIRSKFNIKQFKSEFIDDKGGHCDISSEDGNYKYDYDDPTDSGYDDDTIDDAFEGDPSNLLNVD